MSELKLTAVARTEFGKGAARRLRRSQLVPAVMYGHGTDPSHVALPAHATMMALKQANALLSIELDGDSRLAIAKDVQRNATRDDIEHVDLLIVRRGEKLVVEVPVSVVGEPAPGAIFLIEILNLQVLAEATNLPSHIEISVEGLEPGTQITGADLDLPEGVVYQGDPDAVFVVVSEPREEELEEDEEAVEGEVAEVDADADADEPAED